MSITKGLNFIGKTHKILLISIEICSSRNFQVTRMPWIRRTLTSDTSVLSEENKSERTARNVYKFQLVVYNWSRICDKKLSNSLTRGLVLENLSFLQDHNRWWRTANRSPEDDDGLRTVLFFQRPLGDELRTLIEVIRRYDEEISTNEWWRERAK